MKLEALEETFCRLLTATRKYRGVSGGVATRENTAFAYIRHYNAENPAKPWSFAFGSRSDFRDFDYGTFGATPEDAIQNAINSYLESFAQRRADAVQRIAELDAIQRELAGAPVAKPIAGEFDWIWQKEHAG